MPILRDVPVMMTAQDVIASQGSRRAVPELLEAARHVMEMGRTLWRPNAVYDWFDLRAVEGECAYLTTSDGSRRETALRIGPRVDLLGEARRVLIAVASIGPALEQRVHELQMAGDGLGSFLLDSAGVLALGAVGEALRCLAEEAAAAVGWGVSAALSPGSLVGWALQGQRELCSLLPLAEIGVRLNESCVLEPHKSCSVLIGIGPGYTHSKVGSVCRLCALRETCWRRREDPL